LNWDRVGIKKHWTPFGSRNKKAHPFEIKAMKGLDLRELPEAAALMRRYDRKYLCTEADLEFLWEAMDQSHCYVEVNGQRESLYTNDYFDNPELAFYHAHRTGRLRRNKFRLRTYQSNQRSFWELKQKHPRGYQIKVRAALQPGEATDDPRANRAYVDLLAQGLEAGQHRVAGLQALVPNTLQRSLRIEYQRQTLFNPLNGERLTIDRALNASDGTQRLDFGSLVLLELKQARLERHLLDRWSLQGRVQEGSFSKYFQCKRLMLLPSLPQSHRAFIRWPQSSTPIITRNTLYHVE